MHPCNIFLQFQPFSISISVLLFRWISYVAGPRQYAIDDGSSTVLISLDLSTAFDTVDHTILLSRLQTSFGIFGLALAWFHSYLEGHSQFLLIDYSTSPVTLCTIGVPQGSVLGPMRFSLFISHCTLSVHMASCSSSTLKTNSWESSEPTYLRSRITSKIFRYALRSSGDDRHFEPCSSLTKIGSHTIHCAAPAIWNCLPYDISAAPSVSIFQSRLKTHHFKLAF